MDAGVIFTNQCAAEGQETKTSEKKNSKKTKQEVMMTIKDRPNVL